MKYFPFMLFHCSFVVVFLLGLGITFQQPDRDLLYFRRNDIRKIPLDEIKRYVKLYNRGKIKENNEYSKK